MYGVCYMVDFGPKQIRPLTKVPCYEKKRKKKNKKKKDRLWALFLTHKKASNIVTNKNPT